MPGSLSWLASIVVAGPERCVHGCSMLRRGPWTAGVHVSLVYILLMLHEPIEVPASSLTFVIMIDASGYHVFLLPALDGLGGWRVGKQHEEPFIQAKKNGFLLDAVDFAEAEMFTGQRINRKLISTDGFVQLLCSRWC